MLGAQANPARLARIEDEWRLNTAEKLRQGDPDIYSLLTDPDFRLPKVIPDGNYKGALLEFER